VKTDHTTVGFFRKFPLLSWLGAILSFVVVPLFLVHSGLDSTLTLGYEAEKAEAFKKMNDRLNFLLSYSDDRHYFHKLLQNAFKKSLSSKDPLKEIARHIEQLKKKFPGSLRFIVWDAAGNPVESLTDEKGYRYVVKNLYALFSEVASHCRINYPGNPESLPVVKEKINLFRRYLGRFLVPSHLRLPYQAGVAGRCIEADTRNSFPLFWFHSEPELTVYCSLAGNITRKNYGLKHAVRILNNNDKFVSGIVKNSHVSPPLAKDESRDLMFELGKFENASLPQRETAEHLFSFKLLTPSVRGFCLVKKSDLPGGRPTEVKSRFLARGAFFAFIFAFIAYCYSLRVKKLRFSLRLKLALLFLYANGLPLLILGSIGYEYVQQQRDHLIQESHAANEQLLLDIDAGFDRYVDRLSKNVDERLQDLRKRFVRKAPDSMQTPVFKRFSDALGANELHVFNEKGKALVSYRSDNRIINQAILKLFAVGGIIFANQAADEQFEELVKESGSAISVGGQQVVQRGSDILNTLLTKLNKLAYFNFGSQVRLCYATLIGDETRSVFNSLMIVIWKEEQVQADYIKEKLHEFNSKDKTTRIGANFLFSGQLVFPNITRRHRLLPILQKAAALHVAYEENCELDNKSYLVTAISGRKLDKIALAAVKPMGEIEQQLEQLKFYMGFCIALTFIITAGIAFSLSNQFLEPVSELAQTVKQIGKRNFRHRADIRSNDEFGDLGKVFNTSIKELEDLEIGRVVQENLLPGNLLVHSGAEVYAKTVTMTRLGGDYYDFFTIDSSLSGIFMGDVAGHGIPAALIMAMAKSLVLLSGDERQSPELLLTSLHKMLYKLKSKTFKRMMTCQYLTINGLSGKVCLANAGHCFPVLVREQGQQAEYIEVIGTPVGISRRARYQNVEMQLHQGDTLILYSDGMLEAANAQNVSFGTDRFLQLCKTAWNSDLKAYYQAMYQANVEWSAKAEDDITIVIVRVGDIKS
jgi:serine phosphatase RsbU (regulator of sigma subunit)